MAERGTDGMHGARFARAEHSISFEALGTDNAIMAYGPSAPGALETARDRVLQIHHEMNAFADDSDVSRVSAAAGDGTWVEVSTDTVTVLEASRRSSKLSGGAFDVTVRPASSLWHFTDGDVRIPTAAQTEAVRQLVSWTDVEVDPQGRRARLPRKGQAIDLGGIAKGYAADVAREVLSAAGVENALLNLGGTIVAMGTRPDGSPWRVGIQDPTKATGATAASFSATDVAVVTSGVNERFCIADGVRYHHVLDPRTCRPAETDLLSTTIVSTSAIDADGLATATLVMGLKAAVELVRRAGVDAVFVTGTGDVLATFDLSQGR